MAKEIFTRSLQAKAKELKIAPRFLLVAILALSEKPESIESQALKPYFNALDNDVKKAGEDQLKSKNELNTLQIIKEKCPELIEQCKQVFGIK